MKRLTLTLVFTFLVLFIVGPARARAQACNAEFPFTSQGDAVAHEIIQALNGTYKEAESRLDNFVYPCPAECPRVNEVGPRHLNPPEYFEVPVDRFLVIITISSKFRCI